MEFLKGVFIGFLLGLIVAIYVNLSNIASAQTQMTASAPESAMRQCIIDCGYKFE